MFRKTVAVTIAFCLLGQNFAFAAAHTQKGEKTSSLRQLQLQAQADWAAFRAKYGPQAQNLLPAVMAASSPILAKITTLESAQKAIASLEAENQALTNEVKRLNRQLALRDGNLQELKATVRQLETRLTKQNFEITQLKAKEIEQKLLAEKISALKEELSRTSTLFHWITQESQGRNPYVNALADEYSPFWKLFENGTAKSSDIPAFEAVAREFQEMSRELPTEGLVEHLSQLYKAKGGYTVEFAKEAMPLLERSYRVLVRVPARFYVVHLSSFVEAMAQRILSKAGINLFGVGLVAIGSIALVTASNADAHNVLAERIVANPALFIDATPDQLKTIEDDELAANTAREIAAILHAANELSQEDMDFIRQNASDVQTKQAKYIKHELSTLRNVKAY